MKRPTPNIAGIEEQLQAADDMAYIDLTGTPFEDIPETLPPYDLKGAFLEFYEMGRRHERQDACRCGLFEKQEGSDLCGICDEPEPKLIG